MTIDIYTAKDTYVIAKEETEFGSAVTPAVTDYIDRVTGITWVVKQNRMRHNNLGLGPNATSVTNGLLEVSGSMTAQLTNASFFQYLVNGVVVTNTGAQGDPSDVNEVDNIGYSATTCPTLTFEIGVNGTVDDVMTLDGVFFTSWRVSATLGEPIVWSADFRARNPTSSTSAETAYVGPTEEPMTFADGTVTIGSDTVVRLQSIEISGTNNQHIYYNLIGGSTGRLIGQPTMGLRRYDFTMTVIMSDDTTASTLSGTELRELSYGAASATTPESGGTPTECGDMTITLTEGAVAGDETIKFQFDACYIEDISEPVEISDQGGPRMVTITGYALAGKTNSTENTPVEYYTYA